ncbi:hypothetical protein JB92DRAFT_2728765, partial [Gautieria morchelliformis]
WMHAMKYRYGKQPTGMYIDGHECEDVVEYHQEIFLPVWAKPEEQTMTWTNDNVPIPLRVMPTFPAEKRVILWTHDATVDVHRAAPQGEGGGWGSCTGRRGSGWGSCTIRRGADGAGPPYRQAACGGRGPYHLAGYGAGAPYGGAADGAGAPQGEGGGWCSCIVRRRRGWCSCTVCRGGERCMCTIPSGALWGMCTAPMGADGAGGPY